MAELDQLEGQLLGLQKVIERADRLDRLAGNSDFRKLILEDFCVHECANYVHASADPNLDQGSRADALALAQAGGHLNRWFSVISRMGSTALAQIEDVKEVIDQIRAEQVVGEVTN